MAVLGAALLMLLITLVSRDGFWQGFGEGLAVQVALVLLLDSLARWRGGKSIRIGCKPHATYLQGSVIGRLAGRCTLQEQFPLLLSLSFFQPDVDVWGTANEHH